MTILADKYRLGAQIGFGGMASVFRAEVMGTEGFSRPVAIKRIHPFLSSDERFAAMFIKEARVSARLHHPNIVSVLDFDRDEDRQLFLAMELVEGIDLARLLCRVGPLPAAVALHIITEVLRGLGYAHARRNADGESLGLVHRDVSPHNILISATGAVKVSDFGIVRAYHERAEEDATLQGKPGYMSPEQAWALDLDGRADLFSAGVILYEMLIGRRLFAGKVPPAVLAAVLSGPISRLSEVRPDVSQKLDAITMQLLARNRDQRPAHAQEAIDALLACPEASPRAKDALAALMTEHVDPVMPRDAGASGESGESGDELAETVPSGRAARGVRGRDEPELPPTRTMPEDWLRLDLPAKRRSRRPALVWLVPVAVVAVLLGPWLAWRNTSSDETPRPLVVRPVADSEPAPHVPNEDPRREPMAEAVERPAPGLVVTKTETAPSTHRKAPAVDAPRESPKSRLEREHSPPVTRTAPPSRPDNPAAKPGAQADAIAPPVESPNLLKQKPPPAPPLPPTRKSWQLVRSGDDPSAGSWGAVKPGAKKKPSWTQTRAKE